MNSQKWEHLNKLTPDQQEKRFHELGKKLNLVDPVPLKPLDDAPVADQETMEEYQFLKDLLGYT